MRQADHDTRAFDCPRTVLQHVYTEDRSARDPLLYLGVADDAERSVRRELLHHCHERGASIEELRDAVAAERLTLLLVERALAGDGPRYTPREVAEISGVDLALLRRSRAALGVPYLDPDVRALTQADVQAARRVKAFRDAGLPEEGMLQVTRTIGMGTMRIAEANRDLVSRSTCWSRSDAAAKGGRGGELLLLLRWRAPPQRLDSLLKLFCAR